MASELKVEIITIGDELLIGQVIDTNSAWMAQQLNAIGIKVAQITSISDDHDHILKALDEATKRVDIILITGGLGPTKDDITKLALCDFFKTNLVLDQGSLDNVERLFKARNYRMTELNRKQAEVPACCDPLLNENGTAPGMLFRQNGKLYVSMPGVPFEMKAIMSQHVIPLLKPLSANVIIHKTILTSGVGESFLADIIEDWENALPPFIKLAYLPQPGMVRLRISASGAISDGLQQVVNEQAEMLKSLIGEYIFGEDDDTLESVVASLLNAYGLKLALAESCTGGYIAHLLTSMPGSSSFFNGGIVSYANETKINALGVDPHILETYGAVSEETVRAMADGVIKKMSTECSIAVSGIAGPDGGTPEKPVGTVWIAVHTPYGGTVSRKFTFGNKRDINIRRSALAALDMLRRQLVTPLPA